MHSVPETISILASELTNAIRNLPEKFYDLFEYTKTRRTYTHPITLGLLAKILWSLPGTGYVGIDVRLNRGNAKFQPDLVVFDRQLHRELLYIDYESPNSCDQRIPKKDIAAFAEWRAISKSDAPYVLVTTLPTSRSPNWELRYAARGCRNHPFKNRIPELRENPCKFWYAYYAKEIQAQHRAGVHLLNIEGKIVRHVEWSELGIQSSA